MTESSEKLLKSVIAQGRTTLTEYESKQFLSHYKIPVTREVILTDEANLAEAGHTIGYPLVIKGCGPEIRHKTDQDLVRLDIRNEEEARAAYGDILNIMAESDRVVLVQEMVTAKRELMVGMTRDPQFGPTIGFGLGGIFVEILEDVSFRIAPLDGETALEMIKEIKGYPVLKNYRGMTPADLDQLAGILVQVSRMSLDHAIIQEIDINPVLISKGEAVAADALIVLQKQPD